MNYEAKLKKIDEIVEEQVTLVIQGVELVCFAGVCPYPVHEGRTYTVSLSIVIFDEYKVKEVRELAGYFPSIRRIGDGFSYVLTGRLNSGVLDTGLLFQDEIFLRDYSFLDGKLVSVTVDRIDAEFMVDT